MKSCPVVNMFGYFLQHSRIQLLRQQQNQHQQQQIRYFGRKAGHKSFYKDPVPTPKQRRRFERKKRIDRLEVEKHAPPNSKASARRQETQNIIQKALEYQTQPSLLDGSYGKWDAAFDDLMGNTSYLSSSPTPTPANIAKGYDKYLKDILKKRDSNEVPSDDEISRLVRSYRDKQTRRRIGLHPTLQHILQYVPVKHFGMKTYSSLMTCARNTRESRRIMQLMFDHGYSPNEYIYSIFIDMYADSRDLDGCLNIMNEMKSEPNFIQPSLTVYTSLLKACYKIVNDTSMPFPLKVRAGKAGWEAWKELRMNGHQPDVMAYGAIIRLCAARGQAEQCIGFIDEMHQFGVKPTTLIFSAALQAVARSHKSALRFQGGNSNKNLRRQIVAAYHGNMARQLVIKAESCEVEQDDGFITALIMCAAAQGDSASAKAILIASEVRKMDHLRTIGSKAHIDSLRSSDSNDQNMITSGGISTNDSTLNKHVSFNDDTNKHDTRKLSALLSSFSAAMENNGLGDLWGGPSNQGFLNEATLFQMKQIKPPTYHDNSIPGVGGTDIGLSGLSFDAEASKSPVKGRKFKLKKFEGLKDVDGVGFTLDDIDEELYNMYKDEDKYYPEELKTPSITDDDENRMNELEFHMGDQFETSMIKDVNELEDNYEEFFSKKTNTDEDGPVPHEGQHPDFDEFWRELHAGDVSGREKGIDRNDAWSMYKYFEAEEDSEDEDNNILGSSNKNTLHDSNILPQEIQHDHIPKILSKREPDIFDASLPSDMPKKVVNKIRKAFQGTTAEPSLTELVPILRETLPDYLPLWWLKQKNVRDARFAIAKANEENLINAHVLNGMLQVESKANNIDKAIAFHSDQFPLSGLSPSPADDRLVLQMLVENRRISRALAFKDKISSEGRHIDIPSYGSLISHYAKRDEIGSALMLIKECLEVHGYAPGEQSLQSVRLLCRQRDITDEIGLTELIGPDPHEWARKGEKHLKREMSKKGRRGIMQVRNAFLKI